MSTTLIVWVLPYYPSFYALYLHVLTPIYVRIAQTCKSQN